MRLADMDLDVVVTSHLNAGHSDLPIRRRRANDGVLRIQGHGALADDVHPGYQRGVGRIDIGPGAEVHGQTARARRVLNARGVRRARHRAGDDSAHRRAAFVGSRRRGREDQK